MIESSLGLDYNREYSKMKIKKNLVPTPDYETTKKTLRKFVTKNYGNMFRNNYKLFFFHKSKTTILFRPVLTLT